MKLSEIRYSLAVIARGDELAGMDEQTCEYAAVLLISRVRRILTRRAMANAEHYLTRRPAAVRVAAAERAAADRAAAEYRGELARRAAERQSDRRELARWGEELARLAAADEGRADRAADRAGMAVALTRPAPGELAPVFVMRAADRAERAAGDARAAGELARRFRFAVRA